MSGALAPETLGAVERRVRLPRSAMRRQAITYCRLIHKLRRDAVWGGWAFDGPTLRPGSVILEADLPLAGLLIECAGSQGGHGHNRGPTTYILWRYEREAGEFRELARVASVGRDWTQDLGPIVKQQLHPPRPVLVDVGAIAGRLIQAFERETEPLESRARLLVVREIQDRLAAGVAG